MKKTLVIGASENPERYSNRAIRMLRSYSHPVVAIGRKKGQIEDVYFSTEKEDFKDIDTISLYLNSDKQKEYYDYILGLNPKRLIFNPGAENNELKKLAEENDILTVETCTLVLLSTGQF